ncbi:MAG: cytochrome C [Lysobacter sp.]|nr:cytochrome C [Lysobacter sp.]
MAVLALSACQQAPQSVAPVATASAEPNADADLLARGEYIARIGGCNDCHTPGYPESGGTVPKPQWLVGSPLGWNGPWGTTYPANLRLKLQQMDEATWMAYSAGLHTRPPMPDFAVRAMNEQDRRALYRFIRSLGPGGQPAPAYQPPGEAPKPPYVQWVLPAPPPKASVAG